MYKESTIESKVDSFKLTVCHYLQQKKFTFVTCACVTTCRFDLPIAGRSITEAVSPLRFDLSTLVCATVQPKIKH